VDYFIDSTFSVLLCTTLEKQSNTIIGLLREVMEDARNHKPISPLSAAFTTCSKTRGAFQRAGFQLGYRIGFRSELSSIHTPSVQSMK